MTINPKEKWFLGIDIGGQSFKIMACQDQVEKHSAFFTGPTAKHSFKDCITAIREKYDELREHGFKNQPSAIGVGFPGIVRSDGYIKECPNLAHWKGENLKVALEDALGAPVFIENDANCAALAEGYALRENLPHCLIFFAFGTGVGGGILFDGKVLHGRQGFGGEIGHISIESEGRLCNCGAKGCLETYFSTNGIHHTAQASGLFNEVPSVKDLFHGAIHGEQPAKSIVDQSIEYLATGLANICKIFDPDMIVLGGGLTQDQSGQYLIEQLHLHLPAKISFKSFELPSLKISQYQGRAGVLGTLVLAQQNG
jgi:glucokinase